MIDSPVRQSEASPMTTRTSSRTVVFTRPFILAGFEGTQAAGAYVVETEEEFQEGVSFPAWKRRLNVIQLHIEPGLTLNAMVGATELDAALMEDAAAAGIRFESRTRREHRINTKAYFGTLKSRKLADLCAASPVAGL